MDKKTRIISNNILAVEGNDECNFFQALLKHINIESIQWQHYIIEREKDPNFSLDHNIVQLIDIGGRKKFKKEFDALEVIDGVSSIRKLGLVRDAEELKATSAFQSICSVLQSHNLPIPDAMNSIKQINLLRVGIFIMPDNQGAGMLENLCLKTLKGQKIERCIDEFVTCFSLVMQPDENEKFDEPKARVQSYLSARAPIVNSLGLAALRGFWNFNHNCFDEIKTFLHNLFA